MLVTFGEILGRIHFKTAQPFDGSVTTLYFGGTEANVASAITMWGEAAVHVSVIPDNTLGDGALQSLKRFGVQTQFCKQVPGRLGIYYSLAGQGLMAPEVIYDRYLSAFALLEPDWFNWEVILQNVQWFHWSGVTPAISQQTAECLKRALKVCRKKISLYRPISTTGGYYGSMVKSRLRSCPN